MTPFFVDVTMLCIFLCVTVFSLAILIRRKVVLVSSAVLLILPAFLLLAEAFWRPVFAVTQLFSTGLVVFFLSWRSYGQWRSPLQSWSAFGIDREALVKAIADVLQRRGLVFNFYHNRFLLSTCDVRVVVSISGGFAVLGSDASAIRRELVQDVRAELATLPFQQRRPLWILASIGALMLVFSWWTLPSL